MARERRVFFSEEKKQKTFMSSLLTLGRPWPASYRKRRNKSLLVLFFRKELLSLLTLMLALGPRAEAHHSFAMYDPTVTIHLDGTVKEFQWTNPHALLWVIGVTTPGTDPTLWTIELPTSPGNLSRLGWTKHSLSPGDRVVVELNPLRDGQHGGSFRKMTFVATGQVLLVNLRDQPKTEAAK
jgi:hypothetical protein